MERIKLSDEELNSYAPDFFHTTHWRDYCINSNFGDKGEDYTLVLADKGNIKAIVPLIRQEDTLSFQGSYCPKVITDDTSCLQKVSEHIKDYARAKGIKHIMIDGYMPEFLNYTADLSIADLSNLNIRKSYKSLINSAKKMLRYEIIDSSRIEEARFFYNFVANKITRPQIIWDFYKEWIEKGLMSILFSYKNNYLVGIVGITHYADEAYYFMSAVDPDSVSHNITHYLQTIVFDYLKQKGIQYYVLGNVDKNNLLNCPTKKEKDIGFFKSGFGEQRYKIVSEYFIDKDYMKRVFDERLNKYYGAEYE